jgi:hypothetical protein
MVIEDRCYFPIDEGSVVAQRRYPPVDASEEGSQVRLQLCLGPGPETQRVNEIFNLMTAVQPPTSSFAHRSD